MICPKCGGKLIVIDTGGSDNAVFRKRKCVDCSHNIYTVEREATDALSAYDGLYDARYRHKGKQS